jgi:hypothetical protein
VSAAGDEKILFFIPLTAAQRCCGTGNEGVVAAALRATSVAFCAAALASSICLRTGSTRARLGTFRTKSQAVSDAPAPYISSIVTEPSRQ